MNKIAKTAIIENGVKIGNNNIIKDYAIIRKGSIIGNNNTIESHSVIGPYVEIGDNNFIGISAYIGGDPQDLDYKNGVSFVKIGNNNIIREFVTIHRGTKDGSSTIVGNNNYLMAYAHMGHNAKIGDFNIITNTCQLAGYTEVENYSVLSAFTAIHQFCKIGSYCMIGGGAKVNKDVPPFTIAFGTPAKIIGLNIVGLRRNNFSTEDREKIKKMYNIFYHSNLPFTKAIKKIEDDFQDFNPAKMLVEFFKISKRGITAFGRDKR